jgi:hypothetical protein
MTPSLICFAVTPVPSDVSFGALSAVPVLPGRVGDGAPLFALLLHAVATTTSPTTAARRKGRAARTK